MSGAIKFDIRKVFYHSIPSLMELTKDQGVDWSRINELFAVWMLRYAQVPEDETITEESSIYTISIAADKGNQQALGLFTFFDRLFQELILRLTREEKKLITKNIFNLLTNFDHRYLNFVGEIAVLNNLVKSGIFTLDAVESEMQNGKKIDFKLRHKHTSKESYVEIFNIHIDEDRVEDNPDTIRKFFETRLVKKYKNKTANLENEFPLNIIPVIWGGVKGIKIYSDYFKSNTLNIPYSTEPVSFLILTDGKKYFEHKFGRVSQLFE